MTRASFCQEIPSRGQNYIHSFPPWGVPNRRKPRGVGRDCRRLYDPTEGYLFSSRGSEVTTQNRYSPLVEMSVDIGNENKRKGPLQEFGPNQHRRFPRRFHREQKNFYRNPGEDFVYSFCFNDDANDYVYENKINFCSGYFPDYILYPCVNIDNVEPDLRIFLDYYPTFMKVNILSKFLINIVDIINNILLNNTLRIINI